MKGLLRRLLSSQRPEPPAGPSPAAGRYEPPELAADARGVRHRSRSVSIDANTHTFWARGEESATTEVDVEAPAPDFVPTNRRARAAGTDLRPRGNPAFSETLFIELMRGGQFARAFAHISPECQKLWGSIENFAAAQTGNARGAVQGVSVRDIRYLDRWTDPDTNVDHRNVAELLVEYTVGGRSHPARLERTVHLVPGDGRWRSLCVPPQAVQPVEAG